LQILETERLILRHMSTEDAAFILGLLNEPSWLQFIGDRGLRTLDDARAYILNGPDLLKSLFIYEPGVPTYVTDPAELEAFAADANAMFGPVFEAVQSRGDNVEGVRRLIDGSGQMPGYFDSQPQERQDLQMENARTMPLQLAQSAPPVITCEQLGTLTMPVCIAQGELTRPLFSIVSRAAARCIPHCRHMIIPGATHMWPDEDATGFITAVLDFLKDL